MSEVSKNELKYDNSVSFPNNNAGAITPPDLRAFNVDLIDSTVNQTIYNSDSASFTSRIVDANTAIDALELFTSSQDDVNATLATTGSNTFVGTQTINGDLVLSDGSTDVTINVSTVDNALKINNNLSIEGNITTTSDITANGNIIANGNLDINGTVTASLQTGYVWLGGADGTVQAVPSASLVTAGTTDLVSLNEFTASQESKDNTLATYTGSVDTKFTTIGSQSGSWDNTLLNVFTSSQESKDITLATYTGSNDTKWDTLGSQSGSFVTESETGSFARVNVSNTFTEDQTIQGTLNVTTLNATTIHTIIESSSVIFSSGSNILGDDQYSDIQTLNGITNINGATTLSGSLTQTNGNVTITGSILQTGGNSTFEADVTMNSNLNVGMDITADRLVLTGGTGLDLIITGSGKITTALTVGPTVGDAASVSGLGISIINSETADEIGFTNNGSEYGVSGWNGPSIYGNDPSDLYPAFIGFQNKSDWTDGTISILKPLDITGSVSVQGAVTQNITGPAVNTQTDFISVSGATIYGKPYNYVNQGFVYYTGFGTGYENAFITEYYDSLSYNYGAEFIVNGTRVGGSLTASGSGVFASMRIQDLLDGTTFGNFYADDLQIGEFAGGTRNRIGIGHSSLPLLKLSAEQIQVTGSVNGNVEIQGISSTTASFDFSTANFFELTLVDGADTRVEATNVQPGQTINILVKQPAIGTGTISFASNFDFPEIAPYTATPSDNAKDILTFITFSDTSSIYSAGVNNLI